jgi:hypothetical protein
VAKGRQLKNNVKSASKTSRADFIITDFRSSTPEMSMAEGFSGEQNKNASI